MGIRSDASLGDRPGIRRDAEWHRAALNATGGRRVGLSARR
ncbi:hypothetical protein ACGFWI_36385 [Streptomyces sp. NPDC048434]